MHAIVKKAFPGRPDNEALSRTIAVGERVSGELALFAVDHDLADEEKPGEAGPVDLSKLSKAALEALAEKNGVDISGAKNKAEIIAALEAATQPA